MPDELSDVHLEEPKTDTNEEEQQKEKKAQLRRRRKEKRINFWTDLNFILTKQRMFSCLISGHLNLWLYLTSIDILIIYFMPEVSSCQFMLTVAW